jgi:chromosome segregation ATPase
MRSFTDVALRQTASQAWMVGRVVLAGGRVLRTGIEYFQPQVHSANSEKHGITNKNPNRRGKRNRMKTLIQRTLLAGTLTFVLWSAQVALSADSADRAAIVKERIQKLRSGCAEGRNQVTLTLEELNRLLVPGVELRPQFEKFKAELSKMEEQATEAKERATEMKERGQAFFGEWEEQVKTIQNEDIRKQAATRLGKRKKSYDRIISAMQDTKEELAPFLSDLNDIRTMLDSELTGSSVASAKTLIKKANWHGTDVRESLSDMEKELDRVSAELSTYQ